MEVETTGYESETKRVIGVMRKAKIPYMITGALASSYYGLPRATTDLDLVVKLEKSSVGRFVEVARKAEFKIHEKEVLTMVEIGNRVIMETPEAYRVDLWLPRSKYDEVALSRRRREKIFGESMYICSPEDLILHKLKAGRRQDEEDVIGVLIRQCAKLDKKYLSSWAASLGVKKPLRRVIEQAKRASD